MGFLHQGSSSLKNGLLGYILGTVDDKNPALPVVRNVP